MLIASKAPATQNCWQTATPSFFEDHIEADVREDIKTGNLDFLGEKKGEPKNMIDDAANEISKVGRIFGTPCGCK